jgi:hypothetical protein
MRSTQRKENNMLTRNGNSTTTGRSQRRSHNFSLLLVVVTSAVLMGGLQRANAQSFSSGSNGSDGALNLTTPGTVLFDPKSFSPPLDPDGDNVFHFTTINIAAGVTVKLSGKIFTRPVFWLATGAVSINGVLDLNGEDGHPRTFLSSVRAPSVPGAGGYSGGAGGRDASTPAQPGNGPGGGAVYPTAGPLIGGTFTGNAFLVPLVGGSGGAGELMGGRFGGGGGAGGGAILIVSSTSIAVDGIIYASGGNAEGQTALAGGGSGGAIRLVATTITGNGTLRAFGGNGNNGNAFRGVAGRVRIEAFNQQHSLTDGAGNIPPSNATLASPFNVFLPILQSVRVVSVDGVPVNQSPTGSFEMPDVTINSAAAVTVVIEARNIPLGTVVKLHLFSENGADQFVDSTPLAGTPGTSTASASVVLPTGFTRGFIRATWTQ